MSIVTAHAIVARDISSPVTEVVAAACEPVVVGSSITTGPGTPALLAAIVDGTTLNSSHGAPVSINDGSVGWTFVGSHGPCTISVLLPACHSSPAAPDRSQ